MANRSDRLVEILDDFVDATRDVEAAAVISLDGLPMASALPDHMEEDRLGAMAAALLSLGEQAAAGLGRGALSQVFVEGAGGFVFLMSARDRAVLAAVTGHDAKIGLMLYQMRQAAEDIGRVLEPSHADQPDDVAATLSAHEQPAARGGNGASAASGSTVPGPPFSDPTHQRPTNPDMTTGFGDLTALNS